MKERALGGGKSKAETTDPRPPAMFIADHRSLDFLNSIGTPVDTVVEWIANGEDLLDWLVQAKLIDADQATTIRAKAFPGELDEVAAQARALREWFREFVRSHIGRPLTARAQKKLEPLARNFYWLSAIGYSATRLGRVDALFAFSTNPKVGVIVLVYLIATTYCATLCWQTDQALEDLERSDISAERDREQIKDFLRKMGHKADQVSFAANECPYIGLLGAITGIFFFMTSSLGTGFDPSHIKEVMSDSLTGSFVMSRRSLKLQILLR